MNSLPTRRIKEKTNKFRNDDKINTPNELLKRWFPLGGTRIAPIGYSHFHSYPVERDSDTVFYPNHFHHPCHHHHHYDNYHHFQCSYPLHNNHIHNHDFGPWEDTNNHYCDCGFNHVAGEHPQMHHLAGNYPHTNHFENHFENFDLCPDSCNPHHVLHNNNILDLTDGCYEHSNELGHTCPLLPHLTNHSPLGFIESDCYHCWNDCNCDDYLHNGSSLGYPHMLPPFPFVINSETVPHDDNGVEKEESKNEESKKEENKKEENKEKTTKKSRIKIFHHFNGSH